MGLAPFNYFPVGIVAAGVLLWASHEQHGASLRRVLVPSFIFAFSLSVITFGWILPTVHRYTGAHYMLTVFLVILYTILFQTKPLFFFLLKRYFFKTNAFTYRALFFWAACAALIDAFSPELFAWSWGYTLAGSEYLRQWAAVGSVYFLSFLAFVIASIFLQFFILIKKEKALVVFLKMKVGFTLILILFFVGGVLYHTPQNTAAPQLHVLTVQTNIGAADEKKRGDAAFATEAINRLFTQSTEGELLHPRVDLILWPEASMPFHSANSQKENTSIYSSTFDGVLTFLSHGTGATVLYQNMTMQNGHLYSELAARPATNTTYLKRRLVPWGEYLPLEKFLPSLRRVFPDAGRFHAATAAQEMIITLTENGASLPPRKELEEILPYLNSPQKIRERYGNPQHPRNVLIKPILCYEGLFPQDSHTQHASLIVNLSSDAWFGDGYAAWQHAGAASLRAVENGIPLVRAAMSGLSYAVDNRGDFIGRYSVLNTVDTLYTPIALMKRFTLFAYGGMAVFYIFMGMFLFCGVFAMKFHSYGVKE
ncbi:MAG TPA: apolipoprotein N-acyltransferase [Turneriella sp.]|nr:apolipoprotein N-acyltransferase [Turneriella sp.]